MARARRRTFRHEFAAGDRVVLTGSHQPILAVVLGQEHDPVDGLMLRVSLRRADVTGVAEGRHQQAYTYPEDCWDPAEVPHLFTPDHGARRPERCFGCPAPAEAHARADWTSHDLRMWAAFGSDR